MVLKPYLGCLSDPWGKVGKCSFPGAIPQRFGLQGVLDGAQEFLSFGKHPARIMLWGPLLFYNDRYSLEFHVIRPVVLK